jgi:hypothetical protein
LVIVRLPVNVPSHIGRGVPLKSAAGGGEGWLFVEAFRLPSCSPTSACPLISTGPPR